MKAVKNVPATKSQTFILTIKKLQRFGKSLFTHSSLADGKDEKTCHSCVPEAPKSTPKSWIEKLVEGLWKLQLFCSNLWILYFALVVIMFTAWTYLLNLTGNHKKNHRKRRMQHNHHAANISGEITSEWLSHFQPSLHLGLDPKGQAKEETRRNLRQV